MGEIGFGEPWEWRERKLAALPIEVEWELYIQNDAADHRRGSLLIYSELNGEDEGRIIACVNALAGLNPDALGELIAACEDVSGAHSGACNHWKVKAALAKLRGTGGGE